MKRWTSTWVVALAVGALSGPIMADDRSTDKRLSRAQELFKLETGKVAGVAKSLPSESEIIADLDRRNAADLREMRKELQERAKASESDDDGVVTGQRVYVIKKGVLANSLDELLREPGSAVDGGYKLVWRAPQYLVPDDFDVRARDALGAVEKVLEAYNREGVPLEAVLFSGNNVIEVTVSGFRQKARLTPSPVASPEASQ